MARFRVTASSLNVRSAPSPGASIVASAPNGSVVDGFEVAPDGNWRRVRIAGGSEGWMADRYLAPLDGPDAAAAAPAWLHVAESELASGVREVPGDEDNPRIVAYHAATDLAASDDETPWCSAFVNWCMREAGIDGTRSAAARSWLLWGRTLAAPQLGCVTILSRTGDPTKGHVAFYLGREDDDRVRLLGGNQGNAVSIRPYPAARILGHRWPE